MVDRAPKPAKTAQLASAELAALRHIADRRFADAARVVAAYEASQPVPRGIGVDWTNLDPTGDVVALESIFATPHAAAANVLTAAAMMYLWGVSKPYRRWLPKAASGDAVATSLVLRAYKARQQHASDRARTLGYVK